MKDLIKVGGICAVVVLSLGRASADGWFIETVDAGGDVGKYTSIDLDSSNYPHISYFDYSNGDLKYALILGNVTFLKAFIINVARFG